MNIRWLAPACALVVLSGCVAEQPRQAHASAPVVAQPAARMAHSNRFNMTQNGRRMTANDFDVWMKSRGIRIAKGTQAAKRPAASTQARNDRASKRR